MKAGRHTSLIKYIISNSSKAKALRHVDRFKTFVVYYNHTEISTFLTLGKDKVKHFG